MSGMTIRFGTYSASPMLTHVAVGVSAYIFPPDYYPLRSDISLIKVHLQIYLLINFSLRATYKNGRISHNR